MISVACIGTTATATVESAILGYETVRHAQCELLISAEETTQRCNKCSTYRNTLYSMISRAKYSANDCTKPSSHTNYRFMSKSELSERLHNLHSQSRKDHLNICHLKERLEQFLDNKPSVTLDEELHQDIKAIMEENSTNVNLPPNSLQKIFWEQQQQAAALKNSKSMRWHPLMVKWCLYLRHLSSHAYEFVRSSCGLKLPSQRTLRDYTYFYNATTGFSDSVDKHLQATANLNADHEKYIALIIDEVHIKEDLVYDKHSKQLIGFVNLGSTNDQLLAFEKSLTDSPKTELATSMLVVLVRGLFSKLEFPYAQFSTNDTTGDLLFDPIWESVLRLEWCGFHVLAITADGAAPNRRFFRIHDPKAHFINKY